MGAPLYKDNFPGQAKALCQLGATDKEIADFWEVSKKTLAAWKWQHPELARAMILGKKAADDRVEQALYHRAVGYTFDSEKIVTKSVGEGCSEIVRVPIVEHVPPDTVACIFWLKNRKREQWRDKWEIEQVENVTIRVIGGLPEPNENDKVLTLGPEDVRDVTPA